MRLYLHHPSISYYQNVKNNFFWCVWCDLCEIFREINFTKKNWPPPYWRFLKEDKKHRQNDQFFPTKRQLLYYMFSFYICFGICCNVFCRPFNGSIMFCCSSILWYRESGPGTATLVTYCLSILSETGKITCYIK